MWVETTPAEVFHGSKQYLKFTPSPPSHSDFTHSPVTKWLQGDIPFTQMLHSVIMTKPYTHAQRTGGNKARGWESDKSLITSRVEDSVCSLTEQEAKERQ